MDNVHFLYVIGAYLLGSINSAIIVSKVFSLPDPRNLGSGNPGATNVLRTGNKLAAGITLVGDLLKGLIPVLLVLLVTSNMGLVAATGVAALLGHMYPVYYQFKGGKGVATTLGVLFGFDWFLAIVWIGLWLITAMLFRYSSLAALVATLTTLIIGWLTTDTWTSFRENNILIVAAIALMTVLVFWRHRENIKKLLSGNESQIGANK